jgi:surface polysaccharide O-acyltransferase-like enzyme
MPTPLAAAAPRLFFLDWLRIGAFALLVLYHVGMYYVSWDWHVKSPHASPLIEPLMRLSQPWRMSLLFLLSGAATVWMLQRRPQGLLRERAARLLLPLVVGVWLVVPPQSYFEVVQKAGYAGSYLQFLGLYFTAYGGFCRGSDCLVLPTWNHLWFLPYVFAYTALLLLLRRVLPMAGLQTLANRLAALPGWAWWLLPIAWLALLRLALLSHFGSTHALLDDWHNHASYFSVFLAGVLLAARPALLARLEPLRWPALAAALLAWWGIGAYFEHLRTMPVAPEGLRALQRVAHAALQWSALVALLGFARRHLNHDHRWRAPLNEAVFPVYLLHQTLIIVLAMAALPLALHPAIEAPLLVLLTFAGALAAWRVLRHAGPLRPWFGLPRR